LVATKPGIYKLESPPPRKRGREKGGNVKEKGMGKEKEKGK
jgi:hypothetical protein